MLDTELQSRLRLLGLPPAKAADLTARIRDELHPVAAVAATALRVGKATPGLSGNAGGGLKMAGTGASIGKFAGPIGAAVGAVLGAIAGLAIKTGQKPQRAATARNVLAQLRTIGVDGVGRLIDWGGLGNGVGFMLLGQALYLGAGWVNEEGSKLLDHPSSMDKLTLSYITNARRAMVAAAATGQPTMTPYAASSGTSLADKIAQIRDRAGGGLRGYGNRLFDSNGMFVRNVDFYQSGNGLGDYPGATVTIPITGVDNNNLGTFTFVNPGLNAGAMAWSSQVFMPMIQEIRSHGGFAAGAARAAQDPDATHVMALVADKLLSEIAPESLSSAAATSPVAAMPPGIVQLGYSVAAQAAQNGGMPTLVTPVNQSDPNVPYTLPTASPPGVTYGQAITGPNQRDYTIVGTPTNTVYAGQSLPYATVPYAAAPGSNYVATPTTLTPQQDATAGILQTLLSQQQGANFTSPQAQDLLAQIAQQGVQRTPNGPVTALPSWAMPAGIGVAVLLLVFAMRK